MILDSFLIQHLEECAFGFALRLSNVSASNVELESLAIVDSNIEAHLDGLRVSEDAGWDLCKEEFQLEETGELFTAACIAFESNAEKRYQFVREAAGEDLELSGCFISALGWLTAAQARRYIERLLAAPYLFDQRLGLAAASIHRFDIGSTLQDLLASPDPLLRARALKAVGELGRLDLGNPLLAAISEGDPKCRFYAAWSAALLGANNIGPVFQKITLEDRCFADRAVCMAARTLPVSVAYEWLHSIHQNPEHARLATMGKGRSGNPAHIESLIQDMAIPALARVAGEAFSMITGVDIAYEDLEGEWPEGFEAGPTEDPEDEDVEMDADEDLPWPDPALIQYWWHQNQHRFDAGTRYLCGQPITEASLLNVLRHGYQRQRIAAAHELAMLEPGAPLFEWRAPAWRQQALLSIDS